MPLALLVAVLAKAGAASVLQSLRGADPLRFALAVLLYGGCQLLSSVRWALLLRALGAARTVGHLFRLYLIGMFFNQLLPGSIGGDVAKIAALRTPAGAVSVLLDRLLGLCALLLLAGARVDAALSFAGLAVLLLGALALLLLRRLPRLESLRALPGRALLPPLAVSALVQLGNVAVYLLLASALRLAVWPGTVLTFYLATTLAAAAPVSLGGLGVRELVGAGVFAQAGAAPHDAVALALLWTCSATLWALAGGALLLRRGLDLSPSADAPTAAAPARSRARSRDID